jgi:DNA-binding transcriptional MerR regulator
MKEITIPDRLFFKIGEVSQITGIETSVIRFWETEFKKIKPNRSDTGQRLYRKKDVEIILAIKNLLYEQKFTIAGAKQYLKEKDRQGQEPETHINIKPELLEDIKRELKEVKKILKK